MKAALALVDSAVWFDTMKAALAFWGAARERLVAAAAVCLESLLEKWTNGFR